MKRFLLFTCVIVVVLLAAVILTAFLLAPAGIFSSAASGTGNTNGQTLPPDVVALMTSSSSASSSSSLDGAAGTAQPGTGVATPFATSTAIPPATAAPYTVAWGAYAGETPSDTAAFEALVGQPMDMEAVFVGWGNNGAFPSSFEPGVAGKGKTLVVFWQPSDGSESLTQPSYNYASITGGTWDHYLASFAAAAQTYNGPVILVPFEGMNGDTDPWDGTVNGNSAAGFIAAWQHIYTFFSADTNVKFAWDPNASSEPATASNTVDAYYPGAAYVNYVGLNGFNTGNPWQSFADIFAPALSQLETYNKPIYIFSLASAEGSQKAAWITDALTTSMQEYPIAGWIWFNGDGTVNDGGGSNENLDVDAASQGWSVNSDSAALQAFQAAIPGSD